MVFNSLDRHVGKLLKLGIQILMAQIAFALLVNGMVTSIGDFSTLGNIVDGDYYHSETLPDPIAGERAFYLRGTITFETYDYLAAFDVVNLSTTAQTGSYEFGNSWESSYFSFIKPGPRHATQHLIADGTSFTVILKIDQTSGAHDWWVNADLETPESANPTLYSASGGSTAPITGIVFRGGNTTLNNFAFEAIVHYTEFSLYTNGDTPFAAVPESSASSLKTGLLASLLLCVRYALRLRNA